MTGKMGCTKLELNGKVKTLETNWLYRKQFFIIEHFKYPSFLGFVTTRWRHLTWKLLYVTTQSLKYNIFISLYLNDFDYALGICQVDSFIRTQTGVLNYLDKYCGGKVIISQWTTITGSCRTRRGPISTLVLTALIPWVFDHL